jgi:23S rRNA (adenine2030-N6)-methyltransferase
VNYRHQYHAGNYADVFKHALMLPLIDGLQRKDKGVFFLDTHAGRGAYELELAPTLPDGRQRAPEWPPGIGRLWDDPNLDRSLEPFRQLVREFNVAKGAPAGELRFYPGSPCILRDRLRPQDRLALCELREDDAEALELAMGGNRRVKVQVLDGYNALKAMLPPPEKRGFILIDPPFENIGEFSDLVVGLEAALKRFAAGTYGVWYPITERARSEEFKERLLQLNPPPTLCAELQIASESSAVRMKGCGLIVINPPWQVDAQLREILAALVPILRIDEAGSGRITWLVPER